MSECWTKTNSVIMFMMHFMEVRINNFPMKESMREVEREIFTKHKEGYLA